MRDPNYELTSSLNTKMSVMATALRDIANYSDCLHQDEKPVEAPCRCPVCVAKTALMAESDWRYIGNSSNRLANSPREALMVASWARYFKGVGSGTPDHKLSQILRLEDITIRDWVVATSIVQWLATNVGQCILEESGYHYRTPEPKP